MPTPRPETDLARASQLRDMAKGVRGQKAKDRLAKAADALEDRAARNAAKLGRRRPASQRYLV